MKGQRIAKRPAIRLAPSTYYALEQRAATEGVDIDEMADRLLAVALMPQQDSTLLKAIGVGLGAALAVAVAPRVVRRRPSPWAQAPRSCPVVVRFGDRNYPCRHPAGHTCNHAPAGVVDAQAVAQAPLALPAKR